ncbi:MAG: PPC domain-containing protein [Phaeodactylibacter sp.]|nr:PPC domain-containing protein [Phaeodactylibacter sp.]
MSAAMKKFFQLSVILLSLAIPAMAGTGFPAINLKHVPSEKKVTLSIDGLKENTTIILQDDNGYTLMKEETEGQASFAKLLNLDNLPAGNYYLRIQTSLKEVVQPIVLTEKEAIVNPSRQREFFAPVIKANGGYLDISLFNGRLSDVEVTILDQDDNVAFTETLQNVVIVQKRYNLNQLRWGTYTIQVRTPEKLYQQQFNVR